jgi:flavodoxin
VRLGIKKILCVCSFLVCVSAVVVMAAETSELPKTLVVYYSRDGHTKMVGDTLADMFNADVEELVDQKDRTGLLGTATAGADAIAEKTTDLAALKHAVERYDIILIGTPAWFNHVTPAVRSYLLMQPLKGRCIAFFATCNKFGADKAIQQMKELFPEDETVAYPSLPLTHADLQEKDLPTLLRTFKQNVIASCVSE